MTGRGEILVETSKKAGEPGLCEHRGQSVLEARDRGLRQAAASGQSALAQPSAASDSQQDLAQGAEGLGCGFVDRAETVCHGLMRPVGDHPGVIWPPGEPARTVAP